jgi:hypothetical protein
MPSLASMRSVDPAGDAFRPLGPAIKPLLPVQPVPVLKPTGTPGVFEQADGKLVTGLPLPQVRLEVVETGAHEATRQEFVKTWLCRDQLAALLKGETPKKLYGMHTVRIGDASSTPADASRGRIDPPGKRPNPAIFDDLQPEEAATPHTDFARALTIAAAAKDYPADGFAWTPHDPAKDCKPADARYALLRNGDVRVASRVGWWELSDGKCFTPDYEVVGWK